MPLNTSMSHTTPYKLIACDIDGTIMDDNFNISEELIKLIPQIYHHGYKITLISGGVNEYGTVFSITPAGVETILYKFTGSPDGASPQDGLIQGSDGNFYGTTQRGGGSSKGFGTVFKLPPQ